jgi:hypothetical protein
MQIIAAHRATGFRIDARDLQEEKRPPIEPDEAGPTATSIIGKKSVMSSRSPQKTARNRLSPFRRSDAHRRTQVRISRLSGPNKIANLGLTPF